jgi:hypothetical protein
MLRLKATHGRPLTEWMIIIHFNFLNNLEACPAKLEKRSTGKFRLKATHGRPLTEWMIIIHFNFLNNLEAWADVGLHYMEN